jgi:TRAP-type C4-dicarboxylate transport system permease small subunit
MILKIMIVVGYLAICSLITSTWVDNVEDEIKGPYGKISFIVVFLICPFIWVYLTIRFLISMFKKPGDKNVGD